MLLATVMHTGSTSLKKMHPDCDHLHCDETALERVKAGEKTLTTYRDPKKVAESWKRRGWFEHKKFRNMWVSQWEHYHDIIQFDNVEVVPVESLDYHLNHVDGTDNAGKFLNETILDYAYTCSEAASGRLY